jgi:hypothetical protein
MGVPTLEVGYTSATTGRGDHEVHKGHVVALEGGILRPVGHVLIVTRNRTNNLYALVYDLSPCLVFSDSCVFCEVLAEADETVFIADIECVL